METVRSRRGDGTFDIAQSDWLPDWFGDNGRAIIAPLLAVAVPVMALVIGAMANENALERSALVQRRYAGLVDASSVVADPLVRRAPSLQKTRDARPPRAGSWC